MIYFIKREDDTHIKIGVTNNIEKRSVQLEREYRQKIEVLGVHSGDREVEESLHDDFAEFRRGRTEWFEPVPRLLEYIKKETKPVHAFDPETEDVKLEMYWNGSGAIRIKEAAAAYGCADECDFIDRAIRFFIKGNPLEPAVFSIHPSWQQGYY